MQLFTSILVLFSLFKTPEPPTKNITTTAHINTLPTTTAPFNDLLSGIVETPTFRRRVKLYCKTGFHLVMLPRGTLKGSLSNKVIKTHGM